MRRSPVRVRPSAPRTEMVPFLDLQRQNARYAEEIQSVVRQTVDSGRYLNGPNLTAFEEEYAAYIGSRHAISCANGLDALTLILKAYIQLGLLQAGDEIIVPANTFIASVLAVTDNGLKPLLVEPDPDTCEIDAGCIEQALTPKTKALMLVHLYGRCAYTPQIASLVAAHDLLLIEDNAQAHGCRYEGRKTGSLGRAAGHSFYPGKLLGAFGDAGAVTTDDTELAQVVRSLANYGSSRKYIFPYQGRNSRMDEIQAAVLRVKLKYLDQEIQDRRRWARYYQEHISHPQIFLSQTDVFESGQECRHAFHLFPVFCPRREELQSYLDQKGIQTLIHYPVPAHRQDCYASVFGHLSLPTTERLCAQELSLPMASSLRLQEVERVVEALNHF